MWWKVFVNRETAMLSSQKPRECACVVSDQLAADVVPIGFVWQRWLAVTRVTCGTDSCDTVGQTCVTQWDRLVCHSGTLVTVSHQTMLEPHCCCLQSAVGPIWFVDSCDSCVVTIHQTMLWPKPRAGQASKWKYFRCEFSKGAMSTTRQDGPSTGLVAAAVLFVAFAAKDLFSETTPGEDWDQTRWRLRSHQVEILMLFCLSCRSWFPRWSDWHKCGERSQWCNWWRGNFPHNWWRGSFVTFYNWWGGIFLF